MVQFYKLDWEARDPVGSWNVLRIDEDAFDELMAAEEMKERHAERKSDRSRQSHN